MHDQTRKRPCEDILYRREEKSSACDEKEEVHSVSRRQGVKKRTWYVGKRYTRYSLIQSHGATSVSALASTSKATSQTTVLDPFRDCKSRDDTKACKLADPR